MQGVKEKALELLSSGKAQRVLGWKKGEFFYDLTPGTFESVQEVEREFQYGVFAGANLSKYCIAESKKDGVTAVFSSFSKSIKSNGRRSISSACSAAVCAAWNASARAAFPARLP